MIENEFIYYVLNPYLTDGFFINSVNDYNFIKENPKRKLIHEYINRPTKIKNYYKLTKTLLGE